MAQWRAAARPSAAPRVVAACSGGPDSTALMLALWALRAEPTESAPAVHVVCVDHQLRPESAAEAEAVCAVALRLGLSAERVAVTCPPGPSKMAAARSARYQALALAAERAGAQAVLVAHTREDQTETMLMRWLAGAGLLGLCGMEARRELPVPGRTAGAVTLLRPLLTTARAEIEELLAETAALITPLPVRDPANANRHYQRARLRHDIVPLLRQERPELDAHMGQLSAQLRDDADYLDQQAAAAYAELRRQVPARDAQPGITLPLLPTAALHPALFARVMMRASGGGLGQLHIAALASLCADANGTRSLDLPGGRRVERSYAELRFFSPARPQLSPPSAPSAPAHIVPACGQYRFPQGTLSLEWEDTQPEPAARSGSSPGASPSPWGRAIPAPSATSDHVPRASEVRICLPDAAFPLTVRSPRPGDRIRVTAAGGYRKVSDVLIDLKVPRPRRAAILLLCRGEQVLWVIGHRLATPSGGSLDRPTAAPTAPSRVLRARFLPA